MRFFLFLRAVSAALALATPFAAHATFETSQAKAEAATAAQLARDDMEATFGRKTLDNGEYLWTKGSGDGEITRVVISLDDQLAYAYRDNTLIGVSTISSGSDEKPTPTGIFPILDKQRLHRSIKYDNAPMPYMLRLDDYGVALHGGTLPGYPASHGCIRLPNGFAAKLFAATRIGTVVLIGGNLDENVSEADQTDVAAVEANSPEEPIRQEEPASLALSY